MKSPVLVTIFVQRQYLYAKIHYISNTMTLVPCFLQVSTPSTLPSSASVDLPPIHIHADYRPHSADTLTADEGLTEGLVLREGHYLNAVAEVGAFEHSLTTDLLNHLVFVQKVFMKVSVIIRQKIFKTSYLKFVSIPSMNIAQPGEPMCALI